MIVNNNIIIMLIYLTLLFIIAFIANRYSKSHEGYLIGSRSLGSFTAAISAGAADMSGWLLLGLPGAIYMFGLNQIWIAIGLCIGAFFNWTFISGKLRDMSLDLKAITIPDFLAKQVNDNGMTIRVVSSIMIIIFFTIYVSSGFVAGAKVVTEYFAIPYHYSLLLTFLVISLITVIGGFLAVSWGELFQGLIMVGVMFLIPTLAFIKLENIDGSFVSRLLDFNPNAFNLFYGMEFIGILSLLAWGLGYFGQPHILAKFMAMKNTTNHKTARNIALIWMVLGLSFAVIIGLLGASMFSTKPLLDPELVMLEISQYVLNPWFIGLIIIAIVSAIISTANAQLLVVSSVFTNDLKIVKSSAMMNRIIVVVVGLFAVLLALNPHSNILSMVGYAWAGFGACFGPLILISLNSKKLIQKTPAVIGIIVGGVSVILWNIARSYLSDIEIFKLYELLPSFVLSFFTILLLNLKDFSNK